MLVTDMASALLDEEDQFELPATGLPSTEKEIEAVKRELRFIRRSMVNKLHQTMEKLKRFVAFRGSRTVMRLLLEQVSDEREEIRTINLRFFALLEVTERQRELTAADRLENEVKDLQQLVDEHLKDRSNEPPSSIASFPAKELDPVKPAVEPPTSLASVPLSLREVSAPNGFEVEKPAMSVDMNINLADVEIAKSEQALILKQEKEKTMLREELERKELEAKLQWKEQEFKREIQQIKLEHEKYAWRS